MNESQAKAMLMSKNVNERYLILSEMSKVNDPKVMLLLTEEWEYQTKINQILVGHLRAKAYLARGKDELVKKELRKMAIATDVVYSDWDGSGHGIRVVENPTHPELNSKEIHVPLAYFAIIDSFQSLLEDVGIDKRTLRSQNKLTGSAVIVKTSNVLQGQSLTWDSNPASIFDYFPINLSYVKVGGASIRATREEVAKAALSSILKCLPKKRIKIKKSSDCVVTMGSCFASEIHASLTREGIISETLRIEETINTAHANYLLLKSIKNGNVSEDLKWVLDDANMPKRLTKLREILSTCKILILTLGVNAQVIDSDTGKPVYDTSLREKFLSKKVKMTFSGVDENYERIKSIKILIDELAPKAKTYITLSPVPLIGVPSNYSVLERDVVSKSTIRLAIDRAQADLGLDYWPSFEVVKWIGTHIDPELHFRPFGEPDNNSRHVSRWLIDELTKAFIEHTMEIE